MFNFVRIGILVSLLVGVPAVSQKLAQTAPVKVDVSERGFFRLANGSGYEVRQPGSQIGMTISDAGVLDLAPVESGSHARVRLESYGFGASKTLAAVPILHTNLDASGSQMLSLNRSGIEEWFQGSGPGLEQSFRIASRPTNAKLGPLWVKLAVNGDLSPKTVEDGRIELESEKGSEIYYTRLKAWDAKGQALEARMEAVGNSIRISVDDKNAQYPVTIDPTWGQQDRLTTREAHAFSLATAVSGDTAAVGGGGTVKVFVRNQGVWQLQQTFSQQLKDESFGMSIALSGDTLVVGAHSAYLPAAGLFTGMVYVYTRSGTTWTLTQTISPNEPTKYGHFGQDIALEGNTLVVGSPGQAVGATRDVGAVFIYAIDGGTWKQTAKLSSPTVTHLEAFGRYVSLSGNRIAVSTDKDTTYIFAFANSNWTQESTIPLEGVNSLLANRLIINYTLYQLQSGVWTKDTTFPATTGWSNAISPNLIAIGSFASNMGYVTLYRHANGAWVTSATLTASDGQPFDSFGWSVALGETTLIVGASPPTDMTDIYGSGHGACYAFHLGNSRMVFGKTLLRSGESTGGQIYLLNPAPAGGLTIPLVSSNPNLTVPSQVVIAAGSKHAGFTVTASKSLNGRGDATVTATVGDETLKSPLLLDSFIKSVQVKLADFGVGPSTLSGTVTMNFPAPPGGTTVSLASSDTTALTVPATVLIPENSTSVDFSGSIFKVNQPTPVTITATYHNTFVTTQATVTSMLYGLDIFPERVSQDSTLWATIRVSSRAHSDDIVVSVASSKPTIAPVPATITVPAHATDASFLITVPPGASSGTVTFSASYLGAVRTANLAVVTQDVFTIGANATSVRGGSANGLSVNVKLKAPAGKGGLDVSLSSSDPSLASVPPTLHFPEGTSEVATKIYPKAVTSNQVITISATYIRTISKSFTVTP